jgi:hypothetical protein
MTEDSAISNETHEFPVVFPKQENGEIKEIDIKDIKTKSQETEGEVIPIIEDTAVITKVTGTMMEKPDIPSMSEEGSTVTSSNAEAPNAKNKRQNDTMAKMSKISVPENVGNEADRDIKANSKHLLNLTNGIAPVSEISPLEEEVHIKPETNVKLPTDSVKDVKYSLENEDGDPIRPKTQSPHISNKKQSKNDEKFHLGEEAVTKYSAADMIRRDFTGTKQDNQEQNFERPSGNVNDLEGKIPLNANGTLMKKTGEKDLLLIGRPEDITANPLNFKTSNYNDHYHTQMTSNLSSHFWNIGSRSTPIPNTKPTSQNTPGVRPNYAGTELTSQQFQESFLYTAKPPHIQTDEPWKPILPYYTKHSPKPDDDDDDDIGTGVAEVMVIPPSAIENQKTSESQYHDNRYSSRLGQPAPNHKSQGSSSGM